MHALPATLLLSILAEVPLPGTQPNELALPPDSSSRCGCHDSFVNEQTTEPGESYRATLMALSGRDPLFRAALDIASRDRPDLTDLCIRCHVPLAWLSGRSEPGDGSAIRSEDLESVACDMCHRAIRTDPPLIGDGQYTLSSSTAKRARRGVAPGGGGHRVAADTYVGSAELCGACHSLFNPAERAHDATGTDLGVPYYEQRTYEEWFDSVFPGQGKSCIDCHMSRATGAAARGGEVYEDLAVHNLVGGNIFAVRAVALLNPTLEIDGLIPELIRWVDDALASAVDLEITSTAPTPLVVEGGGEISLRVRVTNRTGHKLPTGYPEGRRVYLEVTMTLEGRGLSILSGEWDPASGDLVPDPQLRTYETQHGRVENGAGARTHHLIRMNQILLDTRIPPEGFMPAHPDMVPSGRDYGAPPYRHFDDHTYTFVAPEVRGTTTGTITVRAMVQTVDGEVVRFLLEGTRGEPEHGDLSLAWEMLGHAPPRQMARVEAPIVVREKVVPPDAGVQDAGAAEVEIAGGGCGCTTSSRGAGGLSVVWALLALGRRCLSAGRRELRAAGPPS